MTETPPQAPNLWLSSLQAIALLETAGVTEPKITLAQWAEGKQLRTRALAGRFNGIEEYEYDQNPPDKPLTDGALPDIPSDFWRWVNAGGEGAEAHWGAGSFAARVIYDPEIGSYSDADHWKLFGVTFHAGDLQDLLTGSGAVRPSPTLQDARPATSKAGKPPNAAAWAEFAAGLAYVGDLDGLANFDSALSLHNAVEAYLESRHDRLQNVLTYKTAKGALDLARKWAPDTIKKT